jgi:hypothetical protein
MFKMIIEYNRSESKALGGESNLHCLTRGGFMNLISQSCILKLWKFMEYSENVVSFRIM